MASKSFDSIVSDIIDNILSVNPLIDVKIGTVVRDIFIEVHANQLEALYAIADNAAKAQSVTTALNSQLDRLAYNYNITRNPARSATTALTINIQNGVQAPTPCNIGDQFYTVADVNNPSIVFINTQYQLLESGQTQAILPVIALNPGSSGNVPAYSITQSSYDFATSVYNIDPATGGSDQESDAAFALRIPYNITGQYINTYNGIINTILNIENINGTPFFVTPDNPSSRGPYTVDAYLQRNAGYFGTATSEVAPANQQNYSFKKQPLYELNPINQITVYNPITNQTSIISSAEYEVINDPSDVQQSYSGSVKANQQLRWITAPPSNPYTISYNYDNTVIDSQTAYDIYNEITADVLFKQAHPIPLYISGAVTAAAGSNQVTIYQNALKNLTNLFNSLSINQILPDSEIVYTLLQDNNVMDLTLSNLDTTYEIILNPTTNSAFLTPSAQSQISPLGYYWEIVTGGNFFNYNIVARLWIGKPDIINPNNRNNSTGFNFNTSSYLGVATKDTINVISPQWTTDYYTFYDQNSSTLIINFTSIPQNGELLVLNLVQNNVNANTNLSYVTLAPSLVSQVQAYPNSVQTAIPQYATTLPYGISSIAQASLYKNGVQLMPTTSSAVGDYTIVSGPDPTTGIINIQFTTTPASTDILEYGVLNPNLTISTSSSQFTR